MTGRTLKRRSFLLGAPQSAGWVQEDLNQPDTGEVLIETIAGAISIGSEIPQFRGDDRRSQPIEYPHMTGYESYGRIIAVGEDVSDKFLGETVVAFYGHRTHAVLPLDRVIFSPSRFLPKTALLMILTCDVSKGIRKAKILPEERVLITGAGAIGLLTLWVLKQYGVQNVHVVDPDEERRIRALNLGASAVASPEHAYDWPEEYTVGFECSSRDGGFLLLQQQLLPNGRICVLSDGNIEPLTLSTAFHRKELQVIGSSDGWDYQQHAIWYWRIAEGSPLAKTIFDMHIPVDDLPEVFMALAYGAARAVKVFVDYGIE